MTHLLFLILITIGLAACSSGNLKSAKDYDVPSTPLVRNPSYNPYAAYGQANATWRSPVFNRDGTIVRPVESASQSDRPAYESAPWASGAAGGNGRTPAGTF